MMQHGVGFPDVRWGRSDTRIARAGQWAASTAIGSRVIRSMVPLDRWVLTTTGATSGLPRTTPLVYLLDDDRILLAGSNFGQQRHPAWSANLLAHPRATVTIAGTSYPVTSELLEGDERLRCWEAFKEAARPYQVYGGRTDRTFRVFALSRREEDGDESRA